MHTLTIDTTWDGTPVPDGPQVQLRREGRHLRVDITAQRYGADPVEGPPGRRWRLWEHEVVEVFIAGPGADTDTEYIELELAPTGHWLALRLRGTRNIVDDDLSVEAWATCHDDRWAGSLRLPLDTLPPGPLRVLATAAHGPAGSRRYLSHVPLPAPAPDFHQLHRFTPLGPLNDA